MRWLILALFLIPAALAAQVQYFSCDFSVDNCGGSGASAAGGILNVSSTTTWTWNATLFSWSNITMDRICPTGGNGHKMHVANSASDWLLDGTTWKNEASYSINYNTGVSLDAWQRDSFVTNHTANTSQVCVGTGCSSAGAFGINPATTSMQIETTYAGEDCAIDNLTIYVLDSEYTPPVPPLNWTLLDHSGNGRNLTNYNTTWSGNDGGFNFSGLSTSYLDTPTDLNLNTTASNWSLDMYYKPYSLSDASDHYVYNDRRSGTAFALDSKSGNSCMAFVWNTTGQVYKLYTGVNDSNYQRCTFAYNEQTRLAQVYYNGVLANSTTIYGGMADSNLNPALGLYSVSTTRQFNGSMSGVRIFNSTLSSGDVYALNQSNVSVNCGNLVAWYAMTDYKQNCTDWRLVDHSPIEGTKNLTLNNASLGLTQWVSPNSYNTTSTVTVPLSSTASNVTSSQYDNFTVSLWFKPNAYANNQVIFENTVSSSNRISITMRSNGTISAGFYNGTTYLNASSSQVVPLGQWSHIVFRIKNQSPDVYMNGTFSTGAAFPLTSGSVGSMSILSRTTATNVANGSISDVRTFNRALSNTEIMALDSNTSVACANLYEWYPFTTTQQTCDDTPANITSVTAGAAQTTATVNVTTSALANTTLTLKTPSGITEKTYTNSSYVLTRNISLTGLQDGTTYTYNISACGINLQCDYEEGTITTTSPSPDNTFTFNGSRESWSEDGWLWNGTPTDGYLYALGSNNNSWSPATSTSTWNKQRHIIRFNVANVSYLNFYFAVNHNEFPDNIRFYVERQTSGCFLLKHQGTFSIATIDGSNQTCMPDGADVNATFDVNLVRGKVNMSLVWSNGTDGGIGRISEVAIDSLTVGNRVAVNIGEGNGSGQPKIYDWRIEQANNLPGIGIASFGTPSIGYNNGTGNVTRYAFFNYTVTITCSGNASIGDRCGTVNPILDPKQLNAGDTATMSGYTSNTNYEAYNRLLTEATNYSRYQCPQVVTTGDEFNCPSGFCMWLPWTFSSSSCSNPASDFHTSGSGTYATVDNDTNVLVSDEFSEVGLVLSGGDETIENDFAAWSDTRKSIVLECMRLASADTGNLTVWKVGRNGRTLDALDTTGNYCHTASDTNYRDALAYLMAANNSHYSAANRAEWYAIGLQIAKDSAAKEWIYSCQNTRSWGTVCYWPAAGNAVVKAGFNDANGDPDYYFGYFQDATKMLLSLWHYTGNTTYFDMYQDTMKAMFVAANYSGGTSAASFGVGWYQLEWGLDGEGYAIRKVSSSFDASAPNKDAWDGGGADAPRSGGTCDITHLYNIKVGTINGTTQNMSQYCTAWNATGHVTATHAPKIYYVNNTLKVSTNELMVNGMFIPGARSSYFYTSLYTTKLNNLFGSSNWDASNNRLAGVSYGTAFSYAGVRAAKSLMYGMDLDVGLYGGFVNYSGSGGGGGAVTPFPNITAIPVASGISSSGATITWPTDALSNQTVFYGTTAGVYTNITATSTQTLSHSIVLSGLQPATLYYTKTQSCNSRGCSNQTVNFTTLQTGQKAGDISTVPGSTPFYTISDQPATTACLQEMEAGDSCTVTWEVNATGNAGLVNEFFAYLTTAENTSTVTSASNFVEIAPQLVISNITNVSPESCVMGETCSMSVQVQDPECQTPNATRFLVIDSNGGTALLDTNWTLSTFAGGICRYNMNSFVGSVTGVHNVYVNYTAKNTWSIQHSTILAMISSSSNDDDSGGNQSGGGGGSSGGGITNGTNITNGTWQGNANGSVNITNTSTSVVTTQGGANILQPISGLITQPFCKAGDVAADIPIVLENPHRTSTIYTFTFEGVQCDPVPPVTVPGRGIQTYIIKNCLCPLVPGEQLTGYIVGDDPRDPEAQFRIPIVLNGSEYGLSYLVGAIIMGMVAVLLLGFLVYQASTR